MSRTASDILLALEAKLDVALNIIRTQDLNIKILSNKLNTINESLEKKSVEPPKITIEPVVIARPIEVDRNLMVASESRLPLESEPQGFRRTSRPETFAGDDAYLPKSGPKPDAPKYPVQTIQAPPGRGGPDLPVKQPSQAEAVIVASRARLPQPEEDDVVFPSADQPKPVTQLIQNAIPVQQRVVNAHGKSLFLADVEIIDRATMQQISKTRTNGTGKWAASLGVGSYRIIIRKLEAATKEKLEVTQDIDVDGSVSPLELQTVIIKA